MSDPLEEFHRQLIERLEAQRDAVAELAEYLNRQQRICTWWQQGRRCRLDGEWRDENGRHFCEFHTIEYGRRYGGKFTPVDP
jgi:hypothetical protein